MANQTIAHKTLRFSRAFVALDFEECATEHLLDESLCPNPGATAEILKDYAAANNYELRIVPASEPGISGDEGENRTALRLLALDAIDFTGFDWLYRIPSNDILVNNIR